MGYKINDRLIDLLNKEWNQTCIVGGWDAIPREMQGQKRNYISGA